MLPDANFLSSRAQNQGFCALLAFGSPVFRLFKHKIGIFVLGEVYSGGCSGWSTLGFCPGSAAPARGVLLGAWRGLFVGCKEGNELFSEGGGVCEEQCVHAGGDGTLYVGRRVVCEEALRGVEPEFLAEPVVDGALGFYEALL